jgi:hypothetical protein
VVNGGGVKLSGVTSKFLSCFLQDSGKFSIFIRYKIRK